MAKILVLSDLHLDLTPMELLHEGQHIGKNADLIVLAGDIAEGYLGMHWARAAFSGKPILYVAGNHEFYGRYWFDHLQGLRKTANELGIVFLENDVYEFGGLRFLGCSLWTDFKLNGPKAREQAMRDANDHMYDYVQIKLCKPKDFEPLHHLGQKNLLTPDHTVQRFRESASWLKNELSKGDSNRTVVVTHHAPHSKSVPSKYRGDFLSPAFASNLDRLMGNACLWIHGHLHDSFDYQVQGTRVVSNPRGYRRRNGSMENTAFNLNLLIEVNPPTDF